jgi:hypothetical protein
MKYKGMLYGKISSSYVELKYTSQDIDDLEHENNILSADCKFLESHCKELKAALDDAYKKIGIIQEVIKSSPAS